MLTMLIKSTKLVLTILSTFDIMEVQRKEVTMFKVQQDFNSTRLRKENNELQAEILDKLKDINDTLRDMIEVMKGNK